MIVDKKNVEGGKTKLIFENLIFPQRDFVCWRNLHTQVCLSMCDLLFHPT